MGEWRGYLWPNYSKTLLLQRSKYSSVELTDALLRWVSDHPVPSFQPHSRLPRPFLPRQLFPCVITLTLHPTIIRCWRVLSPKRSVTCLALWMIKVHLHRHLLQGCQIIRRFKDFFALSSLQFAIAPTRSFLILSIHLTLSFMLPLVQSTSP